MNASWFDLLAAAFSGGVVVKLLDYVYQEYRRRSEASESAKKLIDRHLDPILKSADELVGKLRSLAQSDFRQLTNVPIPKDNRFESWAPYLDVLYLFAHFWSRIQILRLEGMYVNLASDERGKKLFDFLTALEATKTRLVDRSWQRGMGEALIEHSNNGVRAIMYIEFVERYLSSNDIQKWFQPVISILVRINHTRERQRLLVYGVILHAFMDTLDSKHLVTRNRPGWQNKLTNRSKRSLKHRVFPVYLPFVERPARYFAV